MSKCHVKELLNLWEGILADATHAFPTLRDEFERDLNRLQRLVAHRGIRVLLEDLPAIGKHLDRSLSCGQYKLSGLPLTKRYSNTVVIPKFLRGLYLLVFHESGKLKENCNVEAIRFVRQLTLAFKKGKLRCTAKQDENEVVEFYAVDSSLPEPEGFWSAEDFNEQGSGLQRCDLTTPVCEPTSADAEGGIASERSTIVSAADTGGGAQSATPSGSAAMARRRVISETYQGFSKSPIYSSRAQSHSSHQMRRKLSSLLARLDIVSNLVTAALGSYDPSVWRFRNGKGAVSEYRGPANKYYWTNWPDKLEGEFPIADCGFHSYSSWADRVHTGREISSRELRSRMVCVPKTYSKPRLIAAEPSSHMWCQQNIWHYFCDRTRRSWVNEFIRFDDQTLNRDLCVVGSRDGTLATVDLSAASDRVTCHAVGQMFRANPKLLNCLRASRTQEVEQKITSKVPSVIRLRKFSTMGNACTFPVESMLFLSIAVSTVLTQRGLRPTKRTVLDLIGQVSVFGDDVIIPVDCRELFVEALGVLHFKVNDSKSFWNGNFRESCGIDAFRGVDVTPAYWRTFNDGKPESLASTVDTRNNFYKKSLNTAADRLASTLPSRIAIVDRRSGVFGLQSNLGPDFTGFKTRFNTALQRTEVYILDKISRNERLPIENDSALLQYFTEDPEPISNWKSGTPQRPQTKLRMRWVSITELSAPCA